MLFSQGHKKFLEYLTVMKNQSERTIEQYNRHLNKFEDYIHEKV
jgi:site-specific recombinase XerD